MEGGKRMTGIQSVSQSGRQTGIQANRQTGRQAGRQADRQTGRQETSRQTYIYADRQTRVADIPGILYTLTH